MRCKNALERKNRQVLVTEKVTLFILIGSFLKMAKEIIFSSFVKVGWHFDISVTNWDCFETELSCTIIQKQFKGNCSKPECVYGRQVDSGCTII